MSSIQSRTVTLRNTWVCHSCPRGTYPLLSCLLHFIHSFICDLHRVTWRRIRNFIRSVTKANMGSFHLSTPSPSLTHLRLISYLVKESLILFPFLYLLFSVSEWQWRTEIFFSFSLISVSSILHMCSLTDCELTLGWNDTPTANQFLIAATIPHRPQTVFIYVMSKHVQAHFRGPLHVFAPIWVSGLLYLGEWVCYRNPVQYPLCSTY